MKLKWPILPDAHNRYSSRHFDGRSLGNFGLHRRPAVKGQPDISLKCHAAVHPRFWSYNVLMSFPPPLLPPSLLRRGSSDAPSFRVASDCCRGTQGCRVTRSGSCRIRTFLRLTRELHGLLVSDPVRRWSRRLK